MEPQHTESAKPAYTYSLNNAKLFSGAVLALFNPGSLEAAVFEAVAEQEELGESGRIHVFIPTNPMSMTPQVFQSIIADIGKHTFNPGTPAGEKAIYGRRNDAFHGMNSKGEEHKAFLVYDSQTQIIADLINRKGQTILSRGVRQKYLEDLSAQLGFPVGWEEKSLWQM